MLYFRHPYRATNKLQSKPAETRHSHVPSYAQAASRPNLCEVADHGPGYVHKARNTKWFIGKWRKSRIWRTKNMRILLPCLWNERALVVIAGYAHSISSMDQVARVKADERRRLVHGYAWSRQSFQTAVMCIGPVFQRQGTRYSME